VNHEPIDRRDFGGRAGLAAKFEWEHTGSTVNAKCQTHLNAKESFTEIGSMLDLRSSPNFSF
jgi:hypothetical protein